MLTNKEAKEAILNGRVCIDGSVIAENIEIENWCEISLDKVVIRQKKTRIYLKFYKPKGMESTLNNTIDGNLAPFFAGYEG